MEEKGSHKQILKSTGIIGGSQVVIIAVGIVRTKILAVLLGPVGMGLNALFQSVVDFVRNATSFGLHYSAVRDIAVATGTDNKERIAETIKVLRRWIWLTGILGALICIVFCQAISRITFNTESYAISIAVLSVAVLFITLSSGQVALLQGLRQIGQMARINVFGVVIGLFVSIPLYYFFGQQGIVPAIVSGALVTLLLSWYFIRPVKTVTVKLSWHETWLSGQNMIRLGFFMIISGLIETAVGYLIRVLISQKMGESGVGQFSAAWSISTLYLSAVLNAMGTDYYPRLSAVHHDQKSMNGMINDQAEVALLVASPIIIGMLSFVHLAVVILYSEKFENTAAILNWQLAADFFKILSWPLGFAILAHGKGTPFILTNLTHVVSYLLISFLGWNLAGIQITGIALLIASAIYLGVVLWYSGNFYGFKWSRKVVLYLLAYLPLLVISFFASRYLTGLPLYVVGTAITGVAGAFSFFQLRKVASLPNSIRKLKLFK